MPTPNWMNDTHQRPEPTGAYAAPDSTQRAPQPHKSTWMRVNQTAIGIALLALVTLYIEGYCLVPHRGNIGDVHKGDFGLYLWFDSPLIARMYVPAAWINAKVSQKSVLIEAGPKRGHQEPRSFEYRANP